MILFAVSGLVARYAYFLGELGPPHAPVAIVLPEGVGAADASRLLEDAGVTESAFWLRLHFVLAQSPSCFAPGPHLLRRATARELSAMLCRKRSRNATKVTLPEGASRFQIAARLEGAGVAARDAFLSASADRSVLGPLGIAAPTEPNSELRAVLDTAEGHLFPSTYEFFIDSEPASVVRTLVEEGERRYRKLADAHAGGAAALAAMGMNKRQILTLASMVEKETGSAEERPIIASVFLNRLRDPNFRRLQSDPTAMYGCAAMPRRIPACADFNGSASPALNRDPANAFSTYANDGLPPGPIANPGEAAILAVLAPAETRYRYFVARGEGRHTFSETYEQHREAVKRLRELRP